MSSLKDAGRRVSTAEDTYVFVDSRARLAGDLREDQPREYPLALVLMLCRGGQRRQSGNESLAPGPAILYTIECQRGSLERTRFPLERESISDQRTILKLKTGFCSAPNSRNHMGSSISVPHGVEPGGYRLADHTGAEDAESHVRLPSTFLAR
jgi:hypothetical protein